MRPRRPPLPDFRYGQVRSLTLDRDAVQVTMPGPRGPGPGDPRCCSQAGLTSKYAAISDGCPRYYPTNRASFRIREIPLLAATMFLVLRCTELAESGTDADDKMLGSRC